MRSKDTQSSTFFSYIMTRKEFFIQVLDQFATNGNELLQILDDIESGEVECFIEDWFTLHSLHFFTHTFFSLSWPKKPQSVCFALLKRAIKCCKCLTLWPVDSAMLNLRWSNKLWVFRLLNRSSSDVILGGHNPPFSSLKLSWRNATFSPSQFFHSRCSYSQQSVTAASIQATHNTFKNHANSRSNIHLR